jgi:TetR/AcrR family tetracycline transcriptional repressor
MAGTYVAEPNTILLSNLVIEILQAAGLPADRAGWAAFAAFHYVLGHTIEEQAQIELNERGVWEPKLIVDGIENKLAATAFTADPAERFGYGLQLLLDGIRQQLAPLPSAAQAADPAAATATASRPGAPNGRSSPGAAPARR